MSERHNVIDLFTKRPLDSAEARAALVRELADLDERIEPLHRRAEDIRRALGLIAIERGMEEDA